MAAVDIILPLRNGESFLQEAVESIRAQTVSDWRLFILDHGSSDRSLELAQALADKDRRIEVSSHPDVESLATLRNIGLKKCDCRYLMIQDADDVSLPNRIALAMRAFEDDPNLAAVSGEAIVVDPAGQPIGRLQFPSAVKAVSAAAFFYYPMVHAATTARFDVLRRLGAEYGKDFLGAVPASDSIRVDHLAEDYILFGQLAILGKCANVHVPVLKYRRHGGSVGIRSPIRQIERALDISRFLAASFCKLNNQVLFEPGPFCNHADYIFDFQRSDYSAEYEVMAEALRRGLGPSAELDRELAFRWVLATRRSAEMMRRYLTFQLKYGLVPRERRTVRNWILRGLRKGKYVYRSGAPAAMTRASIAN